MNATSDEVLVANDTYKMFYWFSDFIPLFLQLISDLWDIVPRSALCLLGVSVKEHFSQALKCCNKAVFIFALLKYFLQMLGRGKRERERKILCVKKIYSKFLVYLFILHFLFTIFDRHLQKKFIFVLSSVGGDGSVMRILT